jgi:dTDP-N-acetylfucosamine:lipid II N-acetylfucosaminyltransferase
MDIGIFNHDKQQALGNIYTLLYLKKKVYLRDTISTWDHLKNYMSVDIYSVNEMNNERYEEFITFDKKVGVNNKNTIRPFLSLDYAEKVWKENFDSMKV